MAYKTVTSLDCDTVTALGGVNTKTGAKNPSSMEGYYLGSRQAQTNDGMSVIHVFQTPKGNQGVWGSADTNTKLAQVTPGTMTLVEFKEKKKISGGKTKKIFNVQQDPDNTIEVATLPTGSANETYVEEVDDTAGNEEEEAYVAPAARPTNLSKVQELLNRNKTK